MRIAIIGNGIAGTALTEEILNLAEDKVKLYVFGAERYPGYNRILITEVLSGKKLLNEIYIKKWQWYEEKGVKLF
ncbi:MAG TPA: hypothetical protein EYH58_02635, partial [Aquifex aeolicus]|nr:hypothetical protein [Aquifex aeolicus]